MRRLAVLPAACCTIACGDAEPVGDSAGTITDSAGITIVLNDVRNANVPQWHLQTELVIGEAQGDEPYTFGEIADVARDSHGRYFVLDRQARRARAYAADGTYLRDIGGPGEGPGELSDAAVRLRVGSGDSVAILDFRQMRLNIYGPDGSARTVPLRYGRQGPYDVHLLPAGALLVRWLTYQLGENDRFVPWDVLLRVDEADGLDTLLRFTYRPPLLGDVHALRRPLITNTALYDVLADGRIAWASLDGEQVAVHAADGTTALLVRNRAWSRHPVSGDAASTLRGLYFARADTSGDRIPDNVVFPDSLPAITALIADPDGGFWVQRMGPVEEIDPKALMDPIQSPWLGGRTWEVYDRHGRLEAQVNLPPRFRVTRVAAASVIGVQRSAIGVERVVRLGIRR